MGRGLERVGCLDHGGPVPGEKAPTDVLGSDVLECLWTVIDINSVWLVWKERCAGWGSSFDEHRCGTSLSRRIQYVMQTG